MPDTTLGITYPSLTDAPQGPAQMQTLAQDVDTLISADRTTRDAAWTLYTASITGTTAGTWTSTSATISTWYTRRGRTVIVNGDITFGSTTSVASLTGSLQISLPVTARATVPSHVGSGLLIDASPTTRNMCAVQLQSTSTIILVKYDGTIATATAPWTWAQSDVIRFQAIYESASAP